MISDEKYIQPGGRIEYIDAMRGFTMILVVLGHVSIYALGMEVTGAFTFHKLFGEFRMPLFFFVSGFVFYKPNFKWDINQTLRFIRKKTSVQILSPLLFLLVYVHVYHLSVAEALYAPLKLGYWFTFTLFAFYLFYLSLHHFLYLLKIKQGILYDALFLLVGLAVYLLIYGRPAILNTAVCNILCASTWHYFLYFIVGSLTRKYFLLFERLLSTTPMVLLSILLFIGGNLLLPDFYDSHNRIAGLLLTPAGIVLVFALFHNHAAVFSKSHKIGFILQSVGRRTLDIYLIHYFFLYNMNHSLQIEGSRLENPLIEFVCSSVIGTVVIAVCLAVSYVLRLSPGLAHFLFGQKRQTVNK